MVDATWHSVSQVTIYQDSLLKAEIGFDNSSNVFIRVTKPDGTYVGVTFTKSGSVTYW